MTKLVIDENLAGHLSRVQTDLAFLQMQLAQSTEEREQHCEIFLEFFNKMTRRTLAGHHASHRATNSLAVNQ